jgi:hypothetical protein
VFDFRAPNFEVVGRLMKQKNISTAATSTIAGKELGFVYHRIGIKLTTKSRLNFR